MEVVECKVAASWMRLDNCLRYRLMALGTRIIVMEDYRHGDSLSRLSEVRTLKRVLARYSEGPERLAMARQSTQRCAFAGSMSRVCPVPYMVLEPIALGLRNYAGGTSPFVSHSTEPTFGYQLVSSADSAAANGPQQLSGST